MSAAVGSPAASTQTYPYELQAKEEYYRLRLAHLDHNAGADAPTQDSVAKTKRLGRIGGEERSGREIKSTCSDVERARRYAALSQQLGNALGDSRGQYEILQQHVGLQRGWTEEGVAVTQIM